MSDDFNELVKNIHSMADECEDIKKHTERNTMAYYEIDFLHRNLLIIIAKANKISIKKQEEKVI